MAEKENAIAIKEETALTVANASLSELVEDLEGLGSITFDTVKVPSGGGLAFEIPSDDPNNPDTAKEIEGVVVFRQNTNAYFASAYTGESVQPDCSSMDGKVGYDLDGHPCNCAECPRNKFVDGHKGCTNKVSLYILQDGALLPLRVVVPPSSIKPLTEYVKRLVIHGKKLAWVRTGITLVKEKSRGGMTFSKMVFTKKGDLTAEEIQQTAEMTAFVKEIVGRRGNADTEAEFTEITEADGELPF